MYVFAFFMEYGKKDILLCYCKFPSFNKKLWGRAYQLVFRPLKIQILVLVSLQKGFKTIPEIPDTAAALKSELLALFFDGVLRLLALISV